jgi:hypothetical protein
VLELYSVGVKTGFIGRLSWTCNEPSRSIKLERARSGPQGCRKVAGFFIDMHYQMYFKKKSAVRSTSLHLPSFCKSNRHMEWSLSTPHSASSCCGGGDGLHIWSEPTNTFNEELRRADKGLSLSSGVGRLLSVK